MNNIPISILFFNNWVLNYEIFQIVNCWMLCQAQNYLTHCTYYVSMNQENEIQKSDVVTCGKMTFDATCCLFVEY